MSFLFNCLESIETSNPNFSCPDLSDWDYGLTVIFPGNQVGEELQSPEELSAQEDQVEQSWLLGRQHG